MNGFSITLIPRSWRIGVWHRYAAGQKKKTIYAFGPFRFTTHWNLQPWGVV